MTDELDVSVLERKGAVTASHPVWCEPMLAMLTDERFSDPNWIFERKFDGERLLIFRKGDRVRLMTRNRNCVNDTYPELVEAFADQPSEDVVVDGEVVAFDGHVTSFSRLQGRMQIKNAEEARASGIPVKLYLFDILHVSGMNVTRLPLRNRKHLLKQVIEFDDPLRFAAHRNEQGEAYFRTACSKGWEGVIAKKSDGFYRQGRSKEWLKFKCAKGQELVIGGFTPPGGSRNGFGALLVGYYDGGELKYAGKVGTGFDNAFLVNFRKRLDQARCDKAPFNPVPEEPEACWVRPEFVAEIGFAEWTKDGKLRHPRFVGLRRDKSPDDVVREMPS
jgi:DNA ligase D-like protein (predicted ligase)